MSEPVTQREYDEYVEAHWIPESRDTRWRDVQYIDPAERQAILKAREG